VNADIAPETPKRAAATTSRTSPSTRERPVAAEKKTVLRARRPPRGRSGGDTAALHYAAVAQGLRPRDFLTHMANIASQEKRIHRAERERLENRRYTSSVRTSFRRLEAAVEAKDGAVVEETYRTLCSRIDRAARSGALHKNTAARKKSRAMRLRARL